MLRIAILLLFLPVAAHADSFTFRMQSLYSSPVQVKFFSKTRAVAWSGDGRYSLQPGEVHQFQLNCRGGEKICFGAWDQSTARNEWAAGRDGDDGCRNCCWHCTNGGQSHFIRLFLASVPGSNRRVPTFDLSDTPPKKPRPPVIID